VLLALAIVAMATQVLGQDPTKWLVGTWKGTGPSPAGQGREDQLEYVFKEDGSYRAEIQSARLGLVNITGTYKVEGDQTILEGLSGRGGRRVPSTVRRIEDNKIQVESTSPIDNKVTISLLSRAK